MMMLLEQLGDPEADLDKPIVILPLHRTKVKATSVRTCSLGEFFSSPRYNVHSVGIRCAASL